jgi:glycosyltransferase involved in cell wall biosynthesis
MMKFSIVTISFNQAEFLERTIRSVIEQERDGFEVEYIIADPGSTDGSRDIIERYRDRIDTVILEKDKGPGDGLNKGFAHATGDIYYYLNSDDTLEPGALIEVARFMRANPDVDVAIGHAWLIDRHDNRLRRLWSEPFRRVTVAYGASTQIQPATFFRAEAFARSGGFNIENRISWDGELLADLYVSGARFASMDAFLGTYRIYDGTFTSGKITMKQHQEYRRRRFASMMGRPWRWYDPAVALVLRVYKHARDPRALAERILRGKVFQRKTEN